MIITDGQIVTLDPEQGIISGQAIAISNGLITDIGPQRDILNKNPDEESAKNQYIMPGNICAHTHFYGAYARGMAIPGAPPKDFPEILKTLWWPLDMALDEESVRLSAQILVIDAIKNGTTTLFDHHASPNFIEGSLDVIAEVIREYGVRGVLCYEVTDRNGEDGIQEGIEENIRFLKKTKDDESGRLSGLFGLHASMTLSNETLSNTQQAVEQVGDTGIHIHVAEHEADEYDSMQKYDLRIIDRLVEFGLLNDQSIVAHGIHIDAREMELLRDAGAFLSHQPRSNMNNGVGVAEIESMYRFGIPVVLGTDGFSHTMWTEMKTAYLLHKVAHRDPRRMNGADLFDISVVNNSTLAQQHFNRGSFGKIQAGAYADLIFVDYHPNTPMDTGNLPWHIIFGMKEGMITTTIVDGEILMKDRQLTKIDEAAVAAKARDYAPEVWRAYNRYVSQNLYNQVD